MEKRQHSRDYRLLTRPNTTQAPGCAAPPNPKRLQSAQIDRNAYREEARAMVRKQRSKIDFLVQQNSALKETVINFYHKNFAELLDDAQSRARGAHENGRLREEIAGSEEELKALEEQIRIFEKQLVVQKQRASGAAGAVGAPRSLFKALKTMEDRLDQATQKFNQQVTANAQLRAQIDSFRKERGIFRTLHRKVEEELRRKTQQVEQTLADCRETYEARDALAERIGHVKELAKREMRDFEHELRDIIALKEKNAVNRLAIATLNDGNKAARQKKRSPSDTATGALAAEPRCVSERQERLRLDLAKLKLVSRGAQPAALVGALEHIQQRNFDRYSSIVVLAAELEGLDAQIAHFRRREGSAAAPAAAPPSLRREGISEDRQQLQDYCAKNGELQRATAELQAQADVYETVFAALHRELAGDAPDPDASFAERLRETERLLMELMVIIGHGAKPVDKQKQALDADDADNLAHEKRATEEFIASLGHGEENDAEHRTPMSVTDFQTLARRKLARLNLKNKMRKR